MQIRTYLDRDIMSRAAARHAARAMRQAIDQHGAARIVVATGASQFAFLDALTTTEGLDWSRVEMFHLDEYVGLAIDHPASFRKYLLDRLISRVDGLRYHLLDCERDPLAAADRVGAALAASPVDVAFIGIGENGHLAFNDPPADFESDRPYLLVTLDEACRRQQVGEGWFASIDDVPPQALSMSIRQILAARQILCIVPDDRKAAAVQSAVEGDVTPLVPASILQTHPDTTLYLDRASAALLSPSTRGAIVEGDD